MKGSLLPFVSMIVFSIDYTRNTNRQEETISVALNMHS